MNLALCRLRHSYVDLVEVFFQKPKLRIMDSFDLLTLSVYKDLFFSAPKDLSSLKFVTLNQFRWCLKAKSQETGVGPEWINLKLIWFWKAPSGCVWKRHLGRYINKWSSVFYMPDVVSKKWRNGLKKGIGWGGFCYNDAQLVEITIASHFGQWSFLTFRFVEGESTAELDKIFFLF